MSAGLYSAGGTLITPYVNIVPKVDTIKVENRLLDGAFHVQTIGTGAKLLDVNLKVTKETLRARLDTAEMNGEEIRIEFDGTYWEGIIRESLEWEKVARVFSTKFELLVVRTGIVVSE